MSLFAVSCILTSIAAVLQGLFVIYRNYKSKLNVTWFFSSFSVGIWSFGLWGVVSASSYNEALLFQYILDIGGIFVPLFYFLFTLTLLNLIKQKRWQLKLAFLMGGILAILSFFPVFKLGMLVNSYDFNYWINPGSLYFLFPVFFAVLMVYSFYLTVVNYNKFTGQTRDQIRYVLIAAIIGFIGGATDFLPQLFNIYPIGNYFIILYIALVTYAIIKFRLMGIRVIASKMYLYISLAIFSDLFFYALVFFDNQYLGGTYTSNSIVFSIIFAIIFSATFISFFNYLQKTSDVIFFRGYNPRKIIKDLVIELNKEIKLDKILDTLVKELERILEVEDVRILVINQSSKNNNNENFYKHIEKSNVVCKKISNDSVVFNLSSLIVRDELEKKDIELKKEFDEHKIKIAAPLVLQKKLIGVLILGEKISKGGYTNEDIEFLEIINSQAAAAIEKARLHKEVEDFSRDLQKKVEQQTKDIREKTDKLQKLLTMRSEFLDITSHQLRTPVSVIKGVLSMIKEGSVPADKWDEFIDAAFKKSFKLEEIIDEILRASEMDSDQFEMNLNPISVEDVLEEVYEDKLYLSNDKGIKLAYIPPKSPLPLVMSDNKYLKHVVRNLINNALQYTPKGSITITAKKEGAKVLIEVTDTGIGIPKKDLPKLFQKFSRAKNAVDTYTDGSGLGLFIIKKIMDAHPGGKIKIEKTEVNKGTTMAVYLPIAKNANQLNKKTTK